MGIFSLCLFRRFRRPCFAFWLQSAKPRGSTNENTPNPDLIGSFSLVCACLNAAEPAPGKQVEQTLKTSEGKSISYLLYLPEGYGASTTNWPLMLFLHGRGESYGPLNLVAKSGPPHGGSR